MSLGDHVNGSAPRGRLQTPTFDRSSDWDREIKRTGASEWRVCSINEDYNISPRFSLHVVCCSRFMVDFVGWTLLQLLQFGLSHYGWSNFHHLLILVMSWQDSVYTRRSFTCFMKNGRGKKRFINVSCNRQCMPFIWVQRWDRGGTGRKILKIV